MPVPVFTSITYLSPWFPLPPGWSKVGVDAFVSPPAGSGQVLAGRLRQGGNVLQVQIGQSATEVVIVPVAPLATSLDYYLDVQWVAQGTQPGSIVWTTAGTVATAPVVTALATLVDGGISGSLLTLSWSFGAAAITPAGANISAYDSAGTSAGFARVQGLGGNVTLNAQATPGSQAYLQAVMPISGTPGAGFAAPFSMGPILAGAPLPVSAPAIVSAAFDGGAVQVGWTVAAPPVGTTAGYDLIVTSGGATPATAVFEAGTGGGMAMLGSAQAGATTLSVAGRARYGRIAGAAGTPLALLTQPPLIDQVAIGVDGASVSARATFPAGTPAGTAATLNLMRNGIVAGTANAASSGATVILPGLTAAPDGWTVRGRIAATVSGAALTGPFSPPTAVLATAPAIRDMTMVPNPDGNGGWIVTLDAGAPPAAGTSLLAKLTQNGATLASQTIVDGTRARFTLASDAIDPAKVAGASLATLSASATGPAAQASFVGAAPTTTAVQNIGAGDATGQPQGLQVDVVAGGQAGQVLTIRLTTGGRVVATAAGGNATHANLPLSQPLDPSLAWYVEGRWTGAGVGDATFGGWSAPVAVLTATTAVTLADYDNGQLALAIQTPQGVAPAQGAYLYVQKTSGGPISGNSVIGTRGTVPVNAASDTWQAAAKPFQLLPESANSRSLAPSSAATALLTSAPALTALAYDGRVVSASWGSVADGAGNAATGAMLQIADGAGTMLTVAVGARSGEAPVQIPPSAQGSATVRVRATLTTAGAQLSGAWTAAIAPLVAWPTPNTVTIDLAATSVNAVLNVPVTLPVGTTFQAWLMAGDLIVKGPVAATVASGKTVVSFGYAATGIAGLAIVAQAQSTVNGVALSGPRSPPVSVLAMAPAFSSVLISPSSETNKWRLDAHWTAPADGAAITNYTLTLVKASDSTTIAQINAGPQETAALVFATSAVTGSTEYRLTLSATSADGSVAPVATTPVWFAAAVFTSVVTDESRVSAQWIAPSGPGGVRYQLRLLDTATGATLAAVTTGATSGGLDIAALGLQPGGSYALALAVESGPVLFQPGSDGTAKSRPTLLLARPTGLTVATRAADGKAVLSWGPVAGSGYTVAFSDGRAPAATVAATYPFPTALAPGADLKVSVRANVVADAVTSTGPASAPLAMPTVAPALDAANYDGTNVTGGWQPVAGASGYNVSVLSAAGAVKASGSTAATAIGFAATLTAADGPFTLVVQALTESGSGLPSAPLPVFRTAWFVSTNQPSSEPPNLYPAATLARQPTRIVIYLPPLANATITVAPVGAFNLAANADPTSKAALPYVLSFAADSAVWTFSANGNPLPPIRPQLQTDYVNFLKAAEVAGATSWGISALQLAISRWMPQTFEESHYYAYGLSLTGGQGMGSIDLRQGLVLRVGFADYTNVWSGDSNSWLNGFAGGSPTDFDVSDSMSVAGTWMLSMDAFVARLTASGAMKVAAPDTLVSAQSAAGVADAADLFFPSFPNPFYRLFFPGTLQTPTGTGSVATTANFALASAGTYTAISTSSATPGPATPVVYFRGRAVLRVMIRVRVNGMELVVPLGTTVGNLLDRYGVRPPATQVQLTGVTIERAAGPGLAVFGAAPAPPPLVYDAARRYMVRLDWATMATYGGPTDATNLPLLHGDRIDF